VSERALGGEPSVTIAIPVLNEEAHLTSCLEAVAAQRYPAVVQVLVVDGGSTDGTRELASRFQLVEVLDNPRGSRPAGLNRALASARGEIFVRVDARTLIDPDYVHACVAALMRTRACIVGGPMRLRATTRSEQAVASAMASRLGAGPAAFRRVPSTGRFVDTVYLGAFRRDVLESLGGFDEDFGGNEDAELAYRARSSGGVYLDPKIVSFYAVRGDLWALARQFYRYGRKRFETMALHPQSIAPRQLAVPLLAALLISPWRRPVLRCYLATVGARALAEAGRDPGAVTTVALAIPTMHLAWLAGFSAGVVRRLRPAPAALNGRRG
jgi:succinoglycan biosynthesis protein ExoA